MKCFFAGIGIYFYTAESRRRKSRLIKWFSTTESVEFNFTTGVLNSLVAQREHCPSVLFQENEIFFHYINCNLSHLYICQQKLRGEVKNA